jgi:hypothetical protein
MSSSPTKKHSTPIQEKITVSKRKIRRQKSKSTQFDSKEHTEIEDIPIETDQNITVQLVLRSIFLFMVFIPIILTSGLAYISTFFRTYIWYRMITMAITAGGAVSHSFSYCHQLLSCYNYRSIYLPLSNCRRLLNGANGAAHGQTCFLSHSVRCFPSYSPMHLFMVLDIHSVLYKSS